MNVSDVRELFLRRLGMRLGPEMAAYVLGRFRAGGSVPVPVMGGDARTGVPVRRFVDLSHALGGTGAEAAPADPTAH